MLPSVFELRFAFNRWTLGDEFLKTTLGMTDAQLDDPAFDVLNALGFTKEQIEEANDYVCGTMMLEGAPHLKAEHYPVFDCANRCGKQGQRFMLYRSPHSHDGCRTTVHQRGDHQDDQHAAGRHDRRRQQAYMLSWKLILKANALYRDGSKLSQPLNTSSR